ncbi:MAG: AI-2E family transporter [Chloroflexi bacterium]|nr:AI-2E family transporter [Chloroflexota bacterium]
MERDPLVRGLLLLLAVISLAWLAGWAWQVASRFADVILLFFLAWLLAFALDPLARRLQRVGLRRPIAVGVVYLGLALVLVAIGVLVIPVVVAQLVQLARSMPALARDFQVRADQFHLNLVERGLPEAQLTDFYRNIAVRAEALGSLLLASSITVATTVVGSLLRTMLVLILSFYFMLDGDKIASLLIEVVPARYREDAAAALEHVSRTFGGFIRGQLIQAAIYGTGTALVMEVARLNYALVIGIFAGIAMLIPFVGPMLAMAPPLILAVLQSPGAFWLVFVLLFVLQFVVVNILAPKVMSESVGLHPLIVFAAVLIGASVAGVWGALFGVPIAAMVYLLLQTLYQRVVLRMPIYRRDVPLSPEAFVPSRDPAAHLVVPPPATVEPPAPPSVPTPAVSPAPAASRAGRTVQ